jgi:peptide/nickel transport system substrate-binding protein
VSSEFRATPSNPHRRSPVSRRAFLGTATAAGAVLLARPVKAQTPAGIPQQITVIQVDEATSLNPLAEFANPGLMVHGHLYEPLVDFTGPDLRVAPKLAVSWDNPKPTLWRFKLRPNVVWHDGTPFTAEDVKFTLDEGKKPTSVKARFLARVQKVEVLDPLTVQVEMDEPYAPILASWAYLYIVQKKAYEALGAAEYGRKPVGTGPYRLVSWQRQQQLLLEAFDGHWRGAHQPKRIAIRGVREPGTRLAELQTGRADLILGVPIELAKTVQTDPALSLVVLPGIRTPYFPFNNKRPPFDDRRVRQAMNYALDREAIVQGILQGFGEMRGGAFSRSDPWFNTDVPEYKYDPERARALLKEAGKDGGVSFTWLLRRDVLVKDEEIMQAIANQLGKVGIKANLQFVENSTWTPKNLSGDFDMSVSGYGKSVEADTIITGVRWLTENSKFYGNKDLDAVVNKARATFDRNQRIQVYRQADKILREDAAGLFSHAQSELFGVSKKYAWKPWAFAGNGALLTYYLPQS